MDDFENLQVEDILDRPEPKKKKDGKAKGDRTELHLCKFLGDHFGTDFSRSVGSGSRGKQARLPEHAKQVYSGDLCVPEKFKWVIECKGGYEDDLDLNNVVDGKGISQLDKFITQVSRDAEDAKRKPLLCWKRNRKPWIAGIKEEDLTPIGFEREFAYRIYYREWILLSLDELLKKTQKRYWFND